MGSATAYLENKVITLEKQLKTKSTELDIITVAHGRAINELDQRIQNLESFIRASGLEDRR
jgi:hypothetical protein